MNVIIPTQDSRMGHIIEKVRHGQRLTLEDGVFLYESDDLLTIGQLANEVEALEQLLEEPASTGGGPA